MNTSSKYLTLFLLCLSTFAFGQDNFADLSSKKRISIAEKEEAEAKKDETFQRIMLEGHELFKLKHYLKAIRKYEEAQDKRPYNVYPKVIISDIELSMKDTLVTLRKAEKETLQKKPFEPQLKPNTPPAPEPEPKPEDDRMEKLDKWEEAERLKRQQERERQEQKTATVSPGTNTEVKQLSLKDFQEDLGEKYPNGTTEEVTTEGNRTITKRIVVIDGKGNEYKRVVHNWGGVFYFKNGEAVTERVWLQETEK